MTSCLLGLPGEHIATGQQGPAGQLTATQHLGSRSSLRRCKPLVRQAKVGRWYTLAVLAGTSPQHTISRRICCSSACSGDPANTISQEQWHPDHQLWLRKVRVYLQPLLHLLLATLTVTPACRLSACAATAAELARLLLGDGPSSATA